MSYSIGKRLKQLREESGLQQKDIAKVLGVTESAIGHYERGARNLDPESIKKLADFFGVSSDYLLGRTNIREPITPTSDDEVNEILESLHKRPEMKVLFSISKKASKEDIEIAVKIIEALKGD